MEKILSEYPVGSTEYNLIKPIITDFPYTEREVKLVQITPVNAGRKYAQYKYITIVSSVFAYTSLSTVVSVYVVNSNSSDTPKFIYSMTLEEFYKYKHLLKNFSPYPHNVHSTSNIYYDSYIISTLNNYYKYNSYINKKKTQTNTLQCA